MVSPSPADAACPPDVLAVRPTRGVRLLALAGGALMLGVGGLLAGLLLVVRQVFSSTEDPLLGESQVSLLGPVVLGVVALLGLVVLAAALRARIDLTAAGELSVRSLPPWRRRSVDCSTLAEICGRRDRANPGRLSAARRRSVPVIVLELRDAQGRELRLNLQNWEHAPLGPALLTWVARSGLTPDDETEALLAAGPR